MLENGDTITYDLSTEAEQPDCAIKQITTFFRSESAVKMFPKGF